MKITGANQVKGHFTHFVQLDQYIAKPDLTQSSLFFVAAPSWLPKLPYGATVRTTATSEPFQNTNSHCSLTFLVQTEYQMLNIKLKRT